MWIIEVSSMEGKTWEDFFFLFLNNTMAYVRTTCEAKEGMEGRNVPYIIFILSLRKSMVSKLISKCRLKSTGFEPNYLV